MAGLLLAYNLIDINSLAHVTENETCTDEPGDILLNPDGTFPTPGDKARDLLNNTTVRVRTNFETGAHELVTVRRAPFGMPLSEQHTDDKWWLLPELFFEQLEAGMRATIDNLTRVVELEARICAVELERQWWERTFGPFPRAPRRRQRRNRSRHDSGVGL